MTKEELLQKYGQKEPNDFLQLDTFVGEPNNQDHPFIHYDEDGDSQWVSLTTELMSGTVDVRILVLPSVDGKTLSRILRKWSEQIGDGWSSVKEGLIGQNKGSKGDSFDSEI